MPDLADGESVEMKGSGARPYVLKNTGGVYSCSCPAWRNQSVGDRAADLQAPPQAPRRRRRGGPRRRGRRRGPRRRPTARPAEQGRRRRCCWPRRWDSAADLAGWWMSEKLDGVRAYWDGRGSISRLGNPFHAPDWFLAGLPDAPARRRAVDRPQGVPADRRHRPPAGQERPLEGGPLPRLRRPAPTAARSRSGSSFVRDRVGRHRPRYAAAARARGLQGPGPPPGRAGAGRGAGRRGADAPPARLALRGRALGDAAEGQDASSDAEARVVGHQAGRGPAQGPARRAAGASWPTAREFSVGTGFSDAEREARRRSGATITFRYQELSDGGVPRFPSFVGVRDDV